MNPITIPQARILIDAVDMANRGRMYLAVGRDAIMARALVRSGHLVARRNGGYDATPDGINWVSWYGMAMMVAAQYHQVAVGHQNPGTDKLETSRSVLTGTIRNLFVITRAKAYAATLKVGTTNASILDAVTGTPADFCAHC